MFTRAANLVVGAVAMAVLALAVADQASAGTFDVVSCDGAPSGENNAWVFHTDASPDSVDHATSCPASGQLSGIAAYDHLCTVAPCTDFAIGQSAGWRLTAPAGTSITRLQLTRQLGERSDAFAVYGKADGGTIPGETCTIPLNQLTCTVTSPLDVSLNASSLDYGFQCTQIGMSDRCGIGATLHEVWVALYGSRVTITDPSNPTLASTGGPALAGGVLHGTATATATGTDNTGISALRLYVDGFLRGTAALACDYTQLVPCSQVAVPAPVSMNSATIADGTSRQLQVAVVDAAGNETRSAPRSVAIDNVPPAAPLNLTATGGTTHTTNAFGVSWANPDSVAPIDRASWRICPAAGGMCSDWTTQSTTGISSLSGLTVPSAGDWRLDVFLTDSVGNGDPGNVSSTTLRYQPPIPPQATTTTATTTATPTATTGTRPTTTTSEPPPGDGPTTTAPPPSTTRNRKASGLGIRDVRASGNSLIVSGKISRAATGTVTVSVRRRGTRGRGTAHRRRRVFRTTVRHGFWRVEIPKPASRRFKLIVRYLGDASFRATTSTRTFHLPG